MTAAWSIAEAIRSLLGVNLGVRPGERLLLLCDDVPGGGSRELVREIEPVVRSIHPAVDVLVFAPAGGHGKEPPREVWTAALGEGVIRELDRLRLLGPLQNKTAGAEQVARAKEVVRGAGIARVQAVVALTAWSVSHTSFRMLVTGGGARFASMPLFERSMFFSSMAVDWPALAESTRTLARALDGADRCEVRSAAGTDLVLGVAGRPVKADDGLLTAPGAFGNLPAGEVFLAPVEGTAQGVLAIEWGPKARFETPVIVRVEKGRAVEVTGDPEGARWLRALFATHNNNANVAELGVGTNPGASRPDNILEAEKILGTVHIAFGDNAGFGGTVHAPFHQDFVVFDATLKAVWERGGGRRVLLDEGKPGW